MLCLCANIQSQLTINIAEKDKVFKEKLTILTDRSIYAINEKIFFKVYYSTNISIDESRKSKVAYIELIDLENNSFKKTKFPLYSDETEGYLLLPDNLLTGYYLIVAYTKWMENFPGEPLGYSLISIINPYNEKLSSGSIVNRNVRSMQNTPATNHNDSNIFNIRKKTISKREKQVIEIELPDKYPNLKTHLCVSVVKEGALIRNQSNSGFVSFIKDKEVSFHYPEYRGLSLSGRVQCENKEEQPKAFIHASILDEQPEYFGMPVNNDGSFIFNMPGYYGIKDIFINIESLNDSKLNLTINKDFDHHFLVNCPDGFNLNGAEKILAKEIAFNMQIEMKYKIGQESGVQDENKKNISPFYGSADRTTYLDDYIALPNLEEVFYEVVKSVIVIRKKNVPELKVINKYTGIAMSNPLILLDWASVLDQQKLLAMSPENIVKIEIVNDVYIKGGLEFGGIIYLESKEGNMAGYSFSDNAYFMNYTAFEQQNEISFPDYHQDIYSKNIPDFRNCLYWNPDIEFDTNNKTKIEFFSADISGKYLIVLRGIDTTNKIREYKNFFIVE